MQKKLWFKLELVKTYDLDELERFIIRLGRKGEFDDVFHGFGRLHGCTQSPDRHSEGDGLVHTAKVVVEVTKILRTMDLPPAVIQTMFVAGMVHDIDKPATREEKEGGKITFYGHAEMAADRAQALGRKGDLDVESCVLLEWLVRHHMDAHQFPKMGESKRKKFYLHPYFELLAILQEADARASWKNRDGTLHAEVHRQFFTDDSIKLLMAHGQDELDQKLKSAVVAGLMQRGVKPGKYFGACTNAAVLASRNLDLTDTVALGTWLNEYVSQNAPF